MLQIVWIAAYGLPDDEATEEKITKAAEIANIHDFILSLPQVIFYL